MLSYDHNPFRGFSLSVKSLIVIGFLFSAAVLLVSCASPEAPPPTSIPTLAEAENAVFITITTSPYTLAEDSEGFNTIQIEDYSLSSLPGEPDLPQKEFAIALPPDVVLRTVEIQVADFSVEVLEGEYKFKEAVADQPSGEGDSGDGAGPKEIRGEDIVRLLTSGQMRKWQFVKIAYSPFQYDPAGGSLSVVSEVRLRFTYDLSAELLDPALLADETMDDMAEESFFNFETAKEWYQVQD